VTFPGVPFVIIGENRAGAWGFTNAGADVLLDVYEYETDGERYRYEGEWREFDTEDHSIEVADGEDVTVTKRKTVHGPIVEREGERVGVAWTGLTATATTDAIHAYAHSDGVDDFREATRQFDLPTQCVVYADRDGNTYYKVTGRIPVRRVDGEAVPGWRVFDGSAGEGEWAGFTPYGESSWEGFVPFEEKPGALNAGYVATANQRILDDPEYYLGESFSAPFRGERIYELLDEWTAAGDVTPEDMRDLQRDALDTRARRLVPRLLDAVDVECGRTVRRAHGVGLPDGPGQRGRTRVRRRPRRLPRRTLPRGFDAAGLGEEYWPGDWVTVTLPEDAAWFDREATPASASGRCSRPSTRPPAAWTARAGRRTATTTSSRSRTRSTSRSSTIRRCRPTAPPRR